MFEMDPTATRTGLTAADTSAAAQPSALSQSQRIGGYMSPLLQAAAVVHAAREAQLQVHVGANSLNREISVTAVETAEAANAESLSC